MLCDSDRMGCCQVQRDLLITDTQGTEKCPEFWGGLSQVYFYMFSSVRYWIHGVGIGIDVTVLNSQAVHTSRLVFKDKFHCTCKLCGFLYNFTGARIKSPCTGACYRLIIINHGPEKIKAIGICTCTTLYQLDSGTDGTPKMKHVKHRCSLKQK